jgi:hypothetical protein
MTDIVEISNPIFDLYQDKPQAKANYKDFITLQVIVKGDAGALLRGQNVLFSLNGSHARFRELANQKIVGTTDSSGMVTVHLMSNNLDIGTVTVTIVDSTGQPLSGSQSAQYQFIKDPALGIAVAIEKSGAKADGAEQNIVAVSLTDSGQPLAYATVHAKVDGKALFVPDGYNETQATTDSRGIARFYLVDGNNLHENVNFTAYYELAQWLQASTVVPFSDAYNFDISTEVLSNFNIPGGSPNTVKIKLLNNKQIASGFDIVCTLPAASGATFVKNGKKEFTDKTDGTGCLTLAINDTKVEKVQMEARVALQPDKKAYADLEWQRYVIQLAMDINNSLPDGVAQNKIKATVKNDGVLVPSEALVFKIDERSKSKFVDTGTKTAYRTTASDGTASASIVSNSSETYPVVVALQRYTTLHSEINSTFGSYFLTVLEVKNNANGDGKSENSVKVSLTNSGKTVPGKKLFCEMKNKKGVFTSNHQSTSEVSTDANGQAVISMVGTGSIQDTLKVSVEDDTSVFKEVVLNWRAYTISQVNAGQKFVVGTTGIVTVEVKDNGTAVEGIEVVFPSPYNITQKTTSTGRTSANYYSSYQTTTRANVYLKDAPSVSTATAIEFIAKHSANNPNKTYVPYGYDLTYRITDNRNGGAAAAYVTVDARLTMNTAGTPGIPDIWFENYVGNLTPVQKYYQTDGNGKVVIPIRYLLTYPTYWRYELLSVNVDGSTVANYGCYNY